MNLLQKIFGKKDNPSNHEIRNYLNGNLDKGKVRQIEDAMTENPLLSDAVDGFKEFGAEEMDTVPDFEEFYQQKNPQGHSNNTRPYINWIVAALLVAFAVAAIYFYWQESTTERIFADNFIEFKDPTLSESRSGEGLQEWSEIKEKAIIAFQEEDYPKSILYWEKSLENNNDDIQSKFYLGFAHLNDGNPKKSIEYLSAIAGENSDYKEESKWYLALAQLKIKDKEGARETLEDLQKTAGQFYAEQAGLILEQL